MDVANLSVKIGADISGLQTGLKTAQTELANTAAAGTKLSSGLNGVSQATAAGTATMVNFGRVLEDLPYGFIGIANNLNPLLEGFQRMSVQAKEAGVSVGSVLLKSLSGGGGLGLALSAVSAAISFATIGLSMWTRGSKEATEKTDDFTKAVQGFEETAGKSLIKFTELTKIASSLTASDKERKSALQDLRKEYEPYLKNLSDEQILAGQVTSAYEALNKQLLAKVALQAGEEKLKPLFKEMLDLQLKNVELTKVMDAAISVNAESTDKLSQSQKDALNRLKKDTNESADAYASNNARIKELNKSISAIIQTLTNNGVLAEGFDFGDEKIKQTTGNAEKLVEVFTKLKEFPFSPEPILDPEKSRTAITQRLRDTFDVNNPKGVGFDKPLRVPVPVTADMQFKSPEQAKLEEAAKPIVEIISNSIGDAFEKLGEGIGGGSVKGLFSGIFQVIGDGLKALGKQLIITSKLLGKIKEALNTAFTTPGGQLVGIALGVSLIALGTALEKALPKFARGGIITAPTAGIIGEAGPEAVIPLGKMPGLFNGDQNGGTVEFYIQGNALRGVLKRADASANRIG